ncbi:hypothetical protein [Krasilnikoviella flava]|uniref:Uncharacterized protein n=1 Tax=Krasilnikoviella flava TaxID=526729 RepID=A0A1T5J854_9MICO|nr:hypothetical protein [Krasilnikoviella flava]SKC47727.1 hypothetical protein SAMN04324258_1136 [Krasilnikoviella flava]
MTDAYDPNAERTKQLAVVSRKVVFVACVVLMVGGALLIVDDRVALGIGLIVVAWLLALARGGWTLARTLRAGKDRQRAVVPAAPVMAPGAASAVDRVVADLVGMNDDGLPYLVTATPTAGGAQVEVRWKVEEMRWQTLFVKGKVAYAWRMEVDLDPATSKYRFTEYSGTADARAFVGPGGAGARASWSWHRGKTAFQRKMTVVEGADGQVTVAGSTGPRTSWEGVASIQPGDAKEPVFTVLRNHGWRPRFDWAGARLFEK